MSRHTLEEIDLTLDALLENAGELNDSPEDVEALQQKQDALLSHLLSLNASLDDKAKQHVLRSKPYLYGQLDAKLIRLSLLNQRRLRASKERWVKQARVHRNRKKMAS